MKLPELYQAVERLLDAEQADADECTQLAKRAVEIAALTTWAPGAIDPQGRAAEISGQLEARLRERYGEDRGQALAELHDALADLRAAIARHDEDLRPSAGGDDEYYE